MPVHRYNHRPATRMQSAGGRGAFQRIWEAIRARRDDFTLFELHSDSEVSVGAITHYLTALLRGKYIQRIGERQTHTDRQHYTLIRDVGIEYPALNSKGQPIRHKHKNSHEAMWRTLRIVGIAGPITARELADLASTPEAAVSLPMACDYLRHLALAGYVAEVDRCGGRKSARYRMAKSKDTGPRPPVIGRMAYVYDPNLDQVVWEQEASHEQ